MEFGFLLQLLCIICLGSYLQKVDSVPVSNSTAFIPGATTSSPLSEYLEFRSGNGRDNGIRKAMTGVLSRELLKDRLSNVLDNEIKDNASEATDMPEIVTSKNHLGENSLSTLVVPYLCDIEKEMCWLKQNQENLVTVLIPIKLLPNKQPPAQMGLKEIYSLVSEKNKQQIGNVGSTDLNSTNLEHDSTSDAHPRRKRDTQQVEDNFNPQNEWTNEGEYGSNPSSRVQRNAPDTSTDQVTTSTEGRTQRNADPQAGKQTKRSAEMDDDEVEEADSNSPPPDEEYQDDNDMDYQPEKRFAGREATDTPQKFGDSPTKVPSQPIRRAAVSPNNNYPYFANPDYYFPSQRMFSPFDGISYRSVDAMPMMYMDPNPGFWQTKFARSPHYFQQRQSPGYGRGWPPMPNYFPPFANRYSPTYPTPVQQQNRGHYHHQYNQQHSHRPFSYGYAQGNRNFKAPVRKPIETDANMYYGK